MASWNVSMEMFFISLKELFISGIPVITAKTIVDAQVILENNSEYIQ
jgi:hypothetical protein